jgi:hypothetical protein
MAARALLLVALLSVGVVGCDRAREGNPNAPGSPGTGNPREVVRPSAPDTPPGGSSGMKGSLPHPGSSGGDPVPGTTGSGTSDPAGRSETPQPGTGLARGMGGPSGLGMTGTFPSGTTTQSSGEGAAAAGSPNRTSQSRVGTR